MRARYSAFCIKETGYLKDSTDPQLDVDWSANEDWANKATFTGLEIIRSSQEKNKGIVEFKAHFKIEGAEHTHHEISTFRRHQGQWYFRDGRIQAAKK
jgi:SEC-C motif domain protein